jgi:hypothetical protein
VPHVAGVALNQERAVRRAPRGVVEERVPGRRVRDERLAAQKQRTVARSLDPDQVPAPPSTVPLMR